MSYVVALTVKGAVLLTCALLLRRLSRTGPPRLRQAILSIGFAGLIGVALAPVLPTLSLPVLPAVEIDGRTAEVRTPVAGRATGAEPTQTAVVSGTIRDANWRTAPGTPTGPSWPAWIWMAGAGFALARLASELIALKRATRKADRAPEAWNEVARRIAGRAGLATPPLVRVTDFVDTPVVWGVVRPAILVPRAALGWSMDRIRVALLHEIAHIRRGDAAAALLIQVVCAVHWTNPLVWIAARTWRADTEEACDAAVLDSGIDRVAYATHLLEAARAGRTRSTAPAFAAASRLRRRVEAMLEAAGEPRRPALRFVAPACLVALIGAFTVAELTPRAVPAPIEELARLGQADPESRKQAAWRLGDREDPGAVDALLAVLDDPDPEVRAMVAWALGEIKDPRALTALLDALDDPDPLTREMMIRAAGELEDPRAVPELIALLDDPSTGTREAALWALSDFGHEAVARDSIVAALDDPDPGLRATAATVLGAACCKRLEPGLIRALHDPDPTVRAAVVHALGSLGDSAAVGPLIRATRDTDPRVRSQAVWALDEIHQGER